MKKLFIILLCLSTGFAVRVHAQGAQFKFKDGDTFDFGEVSEGPDVTHDFVFTNTGNAPLIIQDAHPSCSCTTPEWPKKPVAPGQTDKIKVGFHTKDHPGPFMKEVYIQSNATNNPNGEKRYTIYIKGTVKK
jgi:Protein of unknown function (DUF1573)